jgi:hypothetical protein
VRASHSSSPECDSRPRRVDECADEFAGFDGRRESLRAESTTRPLRDRCRPTPTRSRPYRIRATRALPLTAAATSHAAQDHPNPLNERRRQPALWCVLTRLAKGAPDSSGLGAEAVVHARDRGGGREDGAWLAAAGDAGWRGRGKKLPVPPAGFSHSVPLFRREPAIGLVRP